MSAPYPDKAMEAAYPPAQQPGGYAPVPTEQPGYPPQQPPPGYTPQQGYPPASAPPGTQGYPQPGYGAPAGNVVMTTAPQPTVIIRQSQVQPNDYLGFAIFVTICCCLPFGIVAIIKSMDVRSRFSAGDYNGAQASSQSAKNWSIAGLVTGIILEVIGIILIIVYFVVIVAAVYTPVYG